MWEPDPQLIERARRGNAGAFEEIVRGHLPDVYRLALRLMRNPHSAEDVTQEAFVRAFQHLRTFRGRSKFSTWLLRITRNCAVDAIRRGVRQESLASRAPQLPSPDLVTRMDLDAAIGRLSQELREPFVLIEVFGLSYAETSQVLGVPSGTLKSRMYRTRRLLMEMLEESENTGEA